MFYTGITRLSAPILEEQTRNMRKNFAGLDQMVKLAEILRFYVLKNELHSIGEMLHEAWMLKKQFATGITNPAIDTYYERAREAGAVGGKLLGAGGGGFLLLYCEPEHQAKVREALSNLQEAPFRFEPQGSKIIYVSD